MSADIARQHALRTGARDDEPGPAPARRLMVGSAHDPAEADADQLADAALSRLSERPSATHELSGARIARSFGSGGPTGPTGAGSAEGGLLDGPTQRGIDAARGGGAALQPGIRRSMEAAFGADFGGVRVHNTTAAHRISRSLSAEAFTSGRDVFFAQGAYDPGSSRGQRVLAHELGHVVQGGAVGGATGIQRLWTPLGKSDEQKAAHAAAKARKKEVLRARAAMKAADAAARAEAKRANATTKAEAGKITAGYGADAQSKTTKSGDHLRLEKDFQMYLDRERAAREAARKAAATGTDDDEAVAELAEEKAADAVWAGAPVRVRAFRPLRFDEFDRALNEVRGAALADKADELGEASALLLEHKQALGSPMDPGKALKKVGEKRALERRQVRAAEGAGKDPVLAAQADAQAAADKAAAKVAKAEAKRPGGVAEQARIRDNAPRKAMEEKYGQNDKTDTAADYIGKAGDATGYVGKAQKYGTKGIAGAMGDSASERSADIATIVGTSTIGLGQAMSFISDVLDFASLVDEIRRGVADPGASLVAVRKGVGALSTAAGLTRTALIAARDGVQAFGGAAGVISDVGTALPVVGLITSVLGVIDASLELVPVSIRLGTGLESLDEAMLAGKAPLAAALSRINARNAQQVEKASFAIARHATMLGLNLAEIGAAGGMGIPMAAKLSVTIVGMAHGLAHTIFDTVNESLSSSAKKDFGVKHKEGASRDVLKYDIGSAVDVLIVASRKHKVAYARAALLDYGATATEVDSMRMHELREKILDGLAAEGDPKTVTEKIQAAKDTVSDALGLEKKPAGPKEDKSTMDSVLAVPIGVGKAFASLPGKIGGQIQAIKDKHADAKKLQAAKNSVAYGGTDDRGAGMIAIHMLRGSDDIEKSFQKVRQDIAAKKPSAALPTAVTQNRHAMLPRSSDHIAADEKLAASQAVGASASTASALQIDKSLIDAVTKAAGNFEELRRIHAGINASDPAQLANLEFIRYAVNDALARAGVKGAP
jgi:hypothetical protein